MSDQAKSNRARPASAPTWSPRAWIMGDSPRAVGPRRALAFGGIALLVGLALVGMRPSDANDTAHIDVGMVITLAALLTVIAGIHFYGRLGPDEVDDKRD